MKIYIVEEDEVWEEAAIFILVTFDELGITTKPKTSMF